MAFKFIVDYLKHRLTAKSRHGTHSPFVYQLVDEVIYDFSDKSEYIEIEEQRKKLLNDHRIINMLNKNRTKQVKQVAKNALKSPQLAQLIYRLAKVQQAQTIIELGTCLGITTAYLAKTNANTKVITIEGCPETAAIANDNFKDLNLHNVALKVGNFNDVLPEVLTTTTSLDFVYIDGNHTEKATLQYFEWCLAKANEDTLLIFDDIYWSEGMKSAWAQIKAHPEVTVTIDLFWIGLVYFRKGQAKEHFKIKF
jgi:predicted O-methyltransferase YrrM